MNRPEGAIAAREGICFKLWENLGDPAAWLACDRSNPARTVAHAAIATTALLRKGALTVAEVGPGPGFDIRGIAEPLLQAGVIASYTAYEGCRGFHDILVERFGSIPGVRIVHGGFTDLTAYDITYTKATLEHQADLTPLRRLLEATRVLSVVSWYLVPSEKEALHYSKRERMHYNRYSKHSVQKVASKAGFSVCELLLPVPGAVYLFTREREGKPT